MKKQLLLFAFSALALTSCEDDDIKAYELDIMKGDWKVSKIEYISGKDNKTVIQTEIPDDCAAKSVITFRTDYIVKYVAYSGTADNCQISDTSEGTYTYNEETKDLNLKFSEEGEQKYRVTVLTSKELKLMQVIDIDLPIPLDFDGDGISDNIYVSYKR
ncbi:lipocalin-like domain-containing protein [Chryseobacterium oryctis]|uniref:Lipocalin family protein n=1 Tax=Chryseobacterium oryctis TaxID=2952618 RepID=A0ABT3HSR7_9FLAO|nr:lipocalin family protein [Chryseobacterium oryctis]MCW3162834.1 lipocalin family protein [Chryseobacterium oryctis]